MYLSDAATVTATSYMSMAALISVAGNSESGFIMTNISTPDEGRLFRLAIFLPERDAGHCGPHSDDCRRRRQRPPVLYIVRRPMFVGPLVN
jgi:hypothetical protein